MSSEENMPANHHGGTSPPQQQVGRGAKEPSPGGKTTQGKQDHTGHAGSAPMYAKFGVILLVSLGLMWVLSMSMVRSITSTST
jgi:hypothetical protein